MKIDDKLINYNLDKESMRFLYDNDMISRKYKHATLRLLQEISYIFEFLSNNTTITPCKDVETGGIIQTYRYTTMLLPIIEYHAYNVVSIDFEYLAQPQ